MESKEALQFRNIFPLILSRLRYEEILAWALTNKYNYSLIQDDYFWKQICLARWKTFQKNEVPTYRQFYQYQYNEDLVKLYNCCIDDEMDILESILNRGIDINYQDNRGSTALFYAVCLNSFDIIKRLLQIEDLDINRGNSILVQAVFDSNIPMIKLLLEVDNIDVNKETPLILACRDGKNEIVDLLLSHKDIDINRGDYNGTTALIWACYRGRIDIVLRLLEENADPHIQNNLGNTALLLAVFNGHDDIVKILLEYSVDIELNNKNGINALHVAHHMKHTEIIEIFDQIIPAKNADFQYKLDLLEKLGDASMIFNDLSNNKLINN